MEGREQLLLPRRPRRPGLGEQQTAKILTGRHRDVRAGIRRRATTYGYSPAERAGADECAAYLENKQDYLDYAAFLAAGWPVASGLIEGAARWLIKDRMEVTGARWGLDSAEAVLRLRALRGNGDLDDYLGYHFQQEKTATTTAAISRPAISRHDHPKHHPTTGMSYLWKSRTRS